MLADRLLANPTYHAEREMQNLELLKTRRGLGEVRKIKFMAHGKRYYLCYRYFDDQRASLGRSSKT